MRAIRQSFIYCLVPIGSKRDVPLVQPDWNATAFQVSRHLENKAFILPGITDEYVVAHFPPDDLLESYSKGFLDFAYWTVKNFIF